MCRELDLVDKLRRLRALDDRRGDQRGGGSGLRRGGAGGSRHSGRAGSREARSSGRDPLVVGGGALADGVGSTRLASAYDRLSNDLAGGSAADIARNGKGHSSSSRSGTKYYWRVLKKLMPYMLGVCALVALAGGVTFYLFPDGPRAVVRAAAPSDTRDSRDRTS